MVVVLLEYSRRVSPPGFLSTFYRTFEGKARAGFHPLFDYVLSNIPSTFPRVETSRNM
jgi:hypothetical protein